MTIHVQFKDSTETTIIAAFAGAQDPTAFPNQAEISETEARYLAFVAKFSGAAVDARRLRDALISACDWTVGADSPIAAATQTAWKTYRQALRDVPAQSGFPTTISWPVPPA